MEITVEQCTVPSEVLSRFRMLPDRPKVWDQQPNNDLVHHTDTQAATNHPLSAGEL